VRPAWVLMTPIPIVTSVSLRVGFSFEKRDKESVRLVVKK